MQSKKPTEHIIQIDHGMIALIKAMTKQTNTEVICQLFELVEDSFQRISSDDFRAHWTTKKVTYPNIPLILKAKTRYDWRGKGGDVTSTFDLYGRKPMRFTAQQVHDMMVETILLGYKGDVDE